MANMALSGVVSNVAPTFDLGMLANLKAWYKANAQSYSNGAALSTVTDSSSNGFNLTAGGSGLTFVTNALNSLPVFRFGGSGYLDYASSVLATGTASPLTLFVVAKFGDFSTYPELCQLAPNQSNTTNGYQCIAFNDGGMYAANAGGNNERYTAAGTLVTGTFYCLTYEIQAAAFSSSQPAFRKNGVLQTPTRGGGTSAPNIVAHKLRIGANLDSPTAQFFTGDIAEMLIINGTLVASDRSNAEGALMSKYNLS